MTTTQPPQQDDPSGAAENAPAPASNAGKIGATGQSETGAAGRGAKGVTVAKTMLASPRTRLAAVGGVVAIVVIIVIVALASRGNSGQNAPVQKKTVTGVSEAGLITLANALHRPVYWFGPRTHVTYEVTQISDGRMFVRYLPSGVKVGTTQAYPLVGTLPLNDAYPRTYAVAHRAGSKTIRLTPNAIAFYNASHPNNAFIAFKGLGYQIQIFDPNPAQMRRIIANDMIQPVAPNAPQAITASVRTAASAGTLNALPARLGHPVYWLGAKPGSKYELTLTPTADVFVRYLPARASIGTNVAYPFVASLPVRNAFAATSAVAAKATSVKITAPGGAVAFYSRRLPTNVYVAYPGSDWQIEVYSPNAKQAHSLVSSGQIRPLP